MTRRATRLRIELRLWTWRTPVNASLAPVALTILIIGSSVSCADSGEICPPPPPAHAYAIHAYSPDALPSGACVGSASCNIDVMQVCADLSAMGPRSMYSCTCADGHWSCVVVAQGAAICRSVAAPSDSGACDSAAVDAAGG